MKYFLKIALVLSFIGLGLKLLLPHENYPIEHFEYLILDILPISWKAVSILSRLLVSGLFVLSFWLLFKNSRWKWMSLLLVSIPFIINPVLLDHLRDQTPYVQEHVSNEIAIKGNQKTLLAYLSYNCLHCKEALFKLDQARKSSKTFPAIKVISYNRKLNQFLQENQLHFELDSISPKSFYEITQGAFPKFALIENNKIIKKYSASQFNYAVLDILSE